MHIYIHIKHRARAYVLDVWSREITLVDTLVLTTGNCEEMISAAFSA